MLLLEKWENDESNQSWHKSNLILYYDGTRLEVVGNLLWASLSRVNGSWAGQMKIWKFENVLYIHDGSALRVFKGSSF